MVIAVCKLWCYFNVNFIIFGINLSYVVNIERWSPSNSTGSPKNSTVYIPTMSEMPTQLFHGMMVPSSSHFGVCKENEGCKYIALEAREEGTTIP